MKKGKNLMLAFLGFVLILGLVNYNSNYKRGARILSRQLRDNKQLGGRLEELIELPYDKVLIVSKSTDKQLVEDRLGHKFLRYPSQGAREHMMVFFLDKQAIAYSYLAEEDYKISYPLDKELEIIGLDDFKKLGYEMEDRLGDGKIYKILKK